MQRKNNCLFYVVRISIYNVQATTTSGAGAASACSASAGDEGASDDAAGDASAL